MNTGPGLRRAAQEEDQALHSGSVAHLFREGSLTGFQKDILGEGMGCQWVPPSGILSQGTEGKP